MHLPIDLATFPDNLAKPAIKTAWSDLAGYPSTLAGYGISDAVPSSAFYKAIRASDLSLSSSASTSVGLSFPYAAGETWQADYRIDINSNAVSGLGFKLNTMPSGCVGRMRCMGPTSALGVLVMGTTTSLTSSLGAFLAFTGTGWVDVTLTIKGGSGSGNVDLMIVTGLLQTGTVYDTSSVVARRV